MEPKLLRYSRNIENSSQHQKSGREFSGKTVLITGGNSGIGYASAKMFASKGAEVVLVCRTRLKALVAIEQLKSEYQYDQKDIDALPTSELKLVPMELDLCSLESAMKFMNHFKQNYDKLDIMILNAGVAGVKKIITDDGMETHFQVNYLTHFLLCLHLVPMVDESTGIVITMSSEAHRVLAKYKINNFQGEKAYGRFEIYGNSKLFQTMAAFSFERRLKKSNIKFICLHPGHITDTALGEHIADMSFLHLLRQCLYAYDGFESDEVANNIVEILKRREFDYHTEVYYFIKRLDKASQDARDKEKQDRVWAYSLKLLEDYLPTKMPEEFK